MFNKKALLSFKAMSLIDRSLNQDKICHVVSKALSLHSFRFQGTLYNNPILSILKLSPESIFCSYQPLDSFLKYICNTIKSCMILTKSCIKFLVNHVVINNVLSLITNIRIYIYEFLFFFSFI